MEGTEQEVHHRERCAQHHAESDRGRRDGEVPAPPGRLSRDRVEQVAVTLEPADPVVVEEERHPTEEERGGADQGRVGQGPSSARPECVRFHRLLTIDEAR
jgi:hypothetical protein